MTKIFQAGLIAACFQGIFVIAINYTFILVAWRATSTPVPPVKRVTPKSYLGPLLAWIEPLALRLVTGGYFTDSPDHVIANEYLPGQGISAHVDCEPCFGPVIASLSLLSPCEMVFRKLEGGTKASIILEPRCLVILSGEGRYNWTHEIPARKSDVIDGFLQPRGRGISLTFRKTIGDV